MSSTCCRSIGGWLAGCGAATAVLSGVVQTILMITSGGNITRLLGGIVVLLLPSVVVFVITCLLTAIPAALVVWLAEEFRIRAAGFFACAGAAIGALSISVLVRSPAVWTSGLVCLFIAAGCIAGLTYWFVMGELAAREDSM
ncbi:hypothetical protein CK489_31250 [Bradyrhizobium sp. UFLA03-84]|uniref:hypothetical protein n=1 Tax=Bradyrhizobium sp. UFLA03-84 TaxID=418599 RepID=UPI000BADE98F|nr:hypothetical protein [Bradyrhizobium sp. UFLA03-84]PAY05073.1 hypothetical protein CK489_31250 [Bradyrhizobium sp. UFLA03-84]